MFTLMENMIASVAFSDTTAFTISNKNRNTKLNQCFSIDQSEQEKLRVECALFCHMRFSFQTMNIKHRPPVYSKPANVTSLSNEIYLSIIQIFNELVKAGL